MDMAIYNLKKAIKSDNGVAHYHNSLGVVLRATGDVVGAVESYKLALEIDPNYPDVYNNLGNALKNMGDVIAAVGCFKSAIKIRPQFAQAYFNLGDALLDIGDCREAIANYQKAISINQKYIEPYVGIGRAFENLSDFQNAVVYYEKSLELYPAGSDKVNNVHSRILKCLFFLGDKTKFSTQLKNIIERGQNNAIIGSFACRAALEFNILTPNPFCNEPLKYLYHTSLTDKCNFKEVFVNKSKQLLQFNEVTEKQQPLLENGKQTAGNIFATDRHFGESVQDLILEEIDVYRKKFALSTEGLFQSWPKDYDLYGWLVGMNTGGAIKPHMHELGWISGSIYINVPKKKS